MARKKKLWACYQCGLTEDGKITHSVYGFNPVLCPACQEKEGKKNG